MISVCVLIYCSFLDYLKPISNRRVMLNAAAPRILPSVAEESGMAKAHVFQRLCKEAKRDLNNAALRHFLRAVPLVREQRVHDLISAPFQLGEPLRPQSTSSKSQRAPFVGMRFG